MRNSSPTSPRSRTRLDEVLKPDGLGCQIGGGTGRRYSYIELALTDLDRGIRAVGIGCVPATSLGARGSYSTTPTCAVSGSVCMRTARSDAELLTGSSGLWSAALRAYSRRITRVPSNGFFYRPRSLR